MEEGGGETEIANEKEVTVDTTEAVSDVADDTKSDEVIQNETKPEATSDEKQNEEKVVKTVKKNPEERLCGWLYQRNRGIRNMKTYKHRYYQFGDENCKLYCYRLL